MSRGIAGLRGYQNGGVMGGPVPDPPRRDPRPDRMRGLVPIELGRRGAGVDDEKIRQELVRKIERQEMLPRAQQAQIERIRNLPPYEDVTLRPKGHQSPRNLGPLFTHSFREHLDPDLLSRQFASKFSGAERPFITRWSEPDLGPFLAERIETETFPDYFPNRQRVDELLDKVSSGGINSLSPEERRILDRASDKGARRTKIKHFLNRVMGPRHKGFIGALAKPLIPAALAAGAGATLPVAAAAYGLGALADIAMSPSPTGGDPLPPDRDLEEDTARGEYYRGLNERFGDVLPNTVAPGDRFLIEQARRFGRR
jgi:hypothetical protein